MQLIVLFNYFFKTGKLDSGKLAAAVCPPPPNFVAILETSTLVRLLSETVFLSKIGINKNS